MYHTYGMFVKHIPPHSMELLDPSAVVVLLEMHFKHELCPSKA